MSEHELDINEHQLDEEWVRQPSLYFKWASKVADAQQAVDDAKNDLELVKADLDHQLRTNPEAYGLKKITESAIASAMVVQPDYQHAQSRLNEARHRAGVVSAMVAALDHRKKALEKLVDLFLANYFSSPRASAEAQEHTDEIERRNLRRGRQR